MSAQTESDSERIACPHCGVPNGDLWEHDWGAGREDIEVECGDCGKPFLLSRRVSVHYTARALP